VVIKRRLSGEYHVINCCYKEVNVGEAHVLNCGYSDVNIWGVSCTERLLQ
jgi:hypothetical protein